MKMTNKVILQVDGHEIPAGTLMDVEEDHAEKVRVMYDLGSARFTHWLPKTSLFPLPPEPQLPSMFLYNFSDAERARLLVDVYMIQFTVSRRAWEDVILPELGGGDPPTQCVVVSPPYTISLRPIPLDAEGYLSVMLSVRYSSTLNES